LQESNNEYDNSTKSKLVEMTHSVYDLNLTNPITQRTRH